MVKSSSTQHAPAFAASTLVARDSFRPKRPAGMSGGALLAVGAHALLVLALAFGVSWRTSTPEIVSAELWSTTTQIAAPPPPPVPVAVPPPPPTPPPPPPEPVLKPAPPPPQPVAQADTRQADIAIERQREADRRAEDERREREKRELARKDKERLEAERREKDKQEQLARKEADEKKKREAEALRREKEDEQRLVRQRDDQLRRMNQQLGDGTPASTSTAARSTSISTEYGGRIRARIKPNIVFNDDAPGNPAAEVLVGVAPTGKIVSRRLTKSSGNKAWDDAVLRAIDRTDMLPRDIDGTIPPSIELVFRPNE